MKTPSKTAATPKAPTAEQAAAGVMAFRARVVDFGESDLPERILVAPWGRSETRKGPVIVDATSLSAVPANQASARFDRVALDFNHGSLSGIEPLKVAAFGIPEVVDGEGIFLKDLQWTPEGREHAAHYCDLSPAVRRDGEGRVTFLHSVALCRQGEIENLDFFSASDLPAADAPDHIVTSDTDAMFRAHLVKLLTAFGATLDADPTDDAIAAAAEAIATARAQSTAGEVGGQQDIDGMAAEAKAAADHVTALSARIAALESEQAAAERDRLVAAASREGKIVPLSAEALAATPVPVLRDIIARLEPGAVPTDSRTAGAATEKPDAFAAIDEATRRVAASCGVSLDDIVKFSPASR